MKDEYTLIKIPKFKTKDEKPACKNESGCCVFFSSAINILDKHCKLCPGVRNWDVFGDKEIPVPSKILKCCPVWNGTGKIKNG